MTWGKFGEDMYNHRQTSFGKEDFDLKADQ